VSANAVLAYERSTPGSQLVWFDRQGKRLGTMGPPADYNTLCLTADDKRLMFDQAEPASGNIDIWSMDVGNDRPSVDVQPPWTSQAADGTGRLCVAARRSANLSSAGDAPSNKRASCTAHRRRSVGLVQRRVPQVQELDQARTPTSWSRR
jgi:hypothetical protein